MDREEEIQLNRVHQLAMSLSTFEKVRSGWRAKFPQGDLTFVGFGGTKKEAAFDCAWNTVQYTMCGLRIP